jgi:hypothetical protein
MKNNNLYYKTVIQVEILSQEPIDNDYDLRNIYYEITEGEWSGNVKTISKETLTGKEMADELNKQGSWPGFFNLTADGEIEDNEY